MLSQGVSPLYAKHVLAGTQARCLIVGYQDAECRTAALEGRDELMPNGEAITVSSHIERFTLGPRRPRHQPARQPLPPSASC